MKDHEWEHVIFDADEFPEHVKLVMRTIEPLQDEFTHLQFVALMQYVTGMLIGMAGMVLPEVPLHQNLKALHEGFAKGVQLYQQDDPED